MNKAKYLCSFLLLSICFYSYATPPTTVRQAIKSNHSASQNNAEKTTQGQNTTNPSGPFEQLTPKPYKTKYAGKYKGIRVTSKRRLKDLGQGVYQLSTEVDAFLIKISEVSTYTLHKDKYHGESNKAESQQNILYPLSYRYSKKGIGKNKHSDMSFDWHKRSISSNDKSNKWTIDLKAGTQDKLSFQQQLRRNLQLADGKFNDSRLDVVKDGRIKQYRFEPLGEETVHTELGYFDTIKIRQFRKGRDRQTIYWFAKHWDYIMIKVRHEEKPGKGNDVLLIKGELAGKRIRGRKSA